MLSCLLASLEITVAREPPTGIRVGGRAAEGSVEQTASPWFPPCWALVYRLPLCQATAPDRGRCRRILRARNSCLLLPWAWLSPQLPTVADCWALTTHGSQGPFCLLALPACRVYHLQAQSGLHIRCSGPA